jgi:hypothetical protein
MNNNYFILLFIYLAFTITMQIFILRSKNINTAQRRIHSILLWLIPMVWGLLVITSMSLSCKDSRSTKKENQHDSEYADNWKNIAGFGGQ